MEQPPLNKNVPQRMWNRDTARHNDYKSEYDLLLSHGLNDEEADLFINSRGEIENFMNELNPFSNEDLFIDNMDNYFDKAIAALEVMKAILHKMTR